MYSSWDSEADAGLAGAEERVAAVRIVGVGGVLVIVVPVLVLRRAGCVTVGRVGVEMEWWAVGESTVGERVKDPEGTLVDCAGGVV